MLLSFFEIPNIEFEVIAVCFVTSFKLTFGSCTEHVFKNLIQISLNALNLFDSVPNHYSLLVVGDQIWDAFILIRVIFAGKANFRRK